MKKLAIQLALVLGLFGLITGGAQAAPTTAPSTAYHEECNREGCDNHEIYELWESFQHECFDEGCWEEEVRELAGGASHINEMTRAFRTKLGKSVSTPAYRGDRTPTFWDWVCENLGSESPYGGCQFIVETPKIPY